MHGEVTMDRIKIKIDGRIAEIESAPEVVTDNAEYEVEFAVDERDGWNPTVPMTALFVRRDARYTAVVMDAGETICTMPPQTGSNVVYIGLTQEEMRTTTPARLPVRRSVRTMTDFPPLPDKDVYAQILDNFAELRMLSGKGAPTTETAGKVNQLYRDETNNRLYVCVNDVDGYTWAMIGGGGGGGTVVTIDTTLTKSGQAADAKAAGDAIGKKLDATALPTAINDALAQAKASGEFNGAKGEKGDKGDTGAQGIRGEKGDTGPAGEKGDTGPAGPKGADGKDGAGMDVTGAKVGQIAKIKAVDSAGKPTAWEPVDMPSGGTYTLPIASPTVLGGVKPIAKTDAMTQGVGVDEAGVLWTAALGGNEIWEEVYSVTFAEETTTFDADLGANYKKIIIAINVDFTANITQNRTIKFVFNQYNKNVFGNNLMSNQYKQMAYCIEVYDAFILSRRMKSDLSTTQNAQPFSDSAGIKQIINRAAIIRDDDPGINHINISTLSSLAFQTGEVIKVYGVLA